MQRLLLFSLVVLNRLDFLQPPCTSSYKMSYHKSKYHFSVHFLSMYHTSYHSFVSLTSLHKNIYSSSFYPAIYSIAAFLIFSIRTSCIYFILMSSISASYISPTVENFPLKRSTNLDDKFKHFIL